MQTQVDFIAILFFLLFAGVGLFIMFMPVNILHQLDRQTGKTILKSAPDQQTGIQRSRLFYRVFGGIFVLIATLTLMSRWPIIYTGDPSQPAAEIFVPWIISAKATAEGDNSSMPIRSIPYFSSDIKQVYISTFTKSLANRPMTYRWFVDQKIQREFTLNYKNGTNLVPLSDSPSQFLPVGEHEVHMITDGATVALVRFRVIEQK